MMMMIMMMLRMLMVTRMMMMVTTTAIISGTNDGALLDSVVLCAETLRFRMVPPAETCNTGDRVYAHVQYGLKW